ncbi:UN family methylase [Cryptosporidium bovis]|uniref:UN family methylase n=1 Tax=Cryptosporidium bovis TaxID=310047 RepID=UPI00351A4A7D|nr:UN family methylase [Cryptosporidium bovis]
MNLSGKYGWIAYHEQLFGRDRLRNYLFPSLSTDSKHIAVVDFSVLYKVTNDRVIINGSIYKRWILPFTYRIQSIPDLRTEYSDIVTISEKNVYFMDAASIIVGCLLNVDIDSTILDLCSAPGGKSLILIRRILENVCYESNLTNLKCKVTCNEFNNSRFERLKRVLVSHIGELNMKRLNVETVSVDATSKSISCFFTKKFLSIIVDAPCSSDRHLILSNTLQNWSLKSAKENQKRQVRILRNALGLLESNGTLLYCTCTLNEKENDDTIEYICKKEGIDSELCLLSLVYTIDKFNNTYSQIEVCIQPLSENYRQDTINISKHRFANSMLGMEEYDKIILEYSKFGAYILPDKNNGIGPLYISIINK